MAREPVHHFAARLVRFEVKRPCGRARLAVASSRAGSAIANEMVEEHQSRLREWARRLRAGACDPAEPANCPPASAWGAEREVASDRLLWQELDAAKAVSPEVVAAIPGLRLAGGGPLLDQAATDAVEVWVDRELSTMHALHRFARLRGTLEWRDRLRDAVDWHVENTGTENATHRPWAVHVFLLHGSPDAEFFASGQLHAVAVEHGEGAPDPCTSWILRDAAKELQLAADAGEGWFP